MSDRSVYWSVTINNPTSADEECLAIARQRGWIVEGQVEQGESGTPHYQLAVNTRVQQRFSALKKVFYRAHIEKAVKPAALRAYVHKEETRLAELPNSERYVNSQKVLWELVVDELVDANADKQYRLSWSGEGSYSERFDPLKALDYACDILIRKGYHCVESMAVNPQVRSAWKSFWSSIYVRRELDRQTDRQAELFSQGDTTTDADGDSRKDSEECSEGGSQGDQEGEDYEDSGSEASEGSDESGSSGGSSEDAGSEYGE